MADITNAVDVLTPRERDCLRLVDQHLSSKQIARELGMSKTSVDTYCDRARRKLGVVDRFQAARLLRELDVGAVLTASGHDTIRTDPTSSSRRRRAAWNRSSTPSLRRARSQ